MAFRFGEGGASHDHGVMLDNRMGSESNARRKELFQRLQQLPRWVMAVQHDLAVELQIGCGLPAAVERQLVEGEA